MKQANDDEKAVLLDVAKKKNLTLETEHHYKLFE
jgi:hypothetical protein